MALGVRPTTLMRGHLAKETNVLTLIAYAMSRFDVVFGMGTATSKRNNVIENKTARPISEKRVNRLIADVAMILVTLNDAFEIHFLNYCSTLACLTTAHCCHKEQTGTRSLTFLFATCSFLLYATFIVIAAIHSIVLSIVLPVLTSTLPTAIIAFSSIPIMLCLVLQEVAIGLLRLTAIAPFIALLNNRLAASFARVLSTFISTIKTIFAGRSIATFRIGINVKGIYRLLILALYADLRNRMLSHLKILNVLKSLLLAMLFPADFTPRLISASAWGLFVKLIKRLFDKAASTNFGRKQRELKNMIQLSHSLHPLTQGVSLASKGAGNILASERFSSIIPQIPIASQFIALSYEMEVLSWH